MKFFVILYFLIFKFNSSACEVTDRKFPPSIDSHATTANRVGRRNSFSPQQYNQNYFRDLISRTEESNENGMMEYTIDPEFSRFLSSKHRKPLEVQRGLNYRKTREVFLPKQGRITGIVKEMQAQSRLKNVDQFLGIPFAAPPTGSNRFMPPSSPLPWSDIKRADKFENVCPQRLPNINDPDNNINKARIDQIKRLLPYLQKESEDCLYLNLYVVSYGELFSIFLKKKV